MKQFTDEEIATVTKALGEATSAYVEAMGKICDAVIKLNAVLGPLVEDFKKARE